MVSPVESQLHLEEIEDNIFRSTGKLWTPQDARGVFGGVVIAQALMAGMKTVSSKFHIHSMHCYFVERGDGSIPIVYHVERVRDGKTFATRTVQAIQRGSCIFTTSLSFQANTGRPSLKHDSIFPREIPLPHQLPDRIDILRKRLKNGEISSEEFTKMSSSIEKSPSGIDIKLVNPCKSE